jgi:hypothetical protein
MKAEEQRWSRSQALQSLLCLIQARSCPSSRGRKQVLGCRKDPGNGGYGLSSCGERNLEKERITTTFMK